MTTCKLWGARNPIKAGLGFLPKLRSGICPKTSAEAALQWTPKNTSMLIFTGDFIHGVFTKKCRKVNDTHYFTLSITYLTRGQLHYRCTEWILNKCSPNLSCKYKITLWLWRSIDLSVYLSIYTHSLQIIKLINKSAFSTIPNIPTWQALQKSWEILAIHYSASLYSEAWRTCRVLSTNEKDLPTKKLEDLRKMKIGDKNRIF